MQMVLNGDKFAIIAEEKDLEDDLANFIIAMSRWSCIILYTASDFAFLIWKLLGDKFGL